MFGRGTSVHLAATFGGSLLFTSNCSLVLVVARTRGQKNILTIFLSIYLSLMVSYCYSIQRDFKKAWLNQQTFWSNVITQAPDLSDGTIIFVVNHDLPATKFIESNSWADPIMLMQIFQFPSNWMLPPRLFVVTSEWTKSIIQENGQLKWEVPTATWDKHWEILPDSNVILLEMNNGKLIRRSESILIDGQTLHLKALSDFTNPKWQKGPLYPLLIQILN